MDSKMEKGMKDKIVRLLTAVFFSAVLFSLAMTAVAADEDCNKCHQAMSKGRVLHGAMKKGCDACHDLAAPRQGPGGASLKSEQPDLCYDCHSRSCFSNATSTSRPSPASAPPATIRIPRTTAGC